MSLPEVLLWRELKARSPRYKFRRQHRWGPFVLDFFCAEVRLNVEIDGEQHRVTTEYDAGRDSALIDAGVCVLRVAAAEVLASPEGCAVWVETACEEVALWRQGGELPGYRSTTGFRCNV